MRRDRGRGLAENLSVSAISFQAQTLIERLNAITEEDYPPQATIIARFLRVLAVRARSELDRIEESSNGQTTEAEQARARALGSIVHVLHSYIRYLQASDPFRSPPGVQQAISLLIAAHGRPALGCEAGEICVLVRPQWTYNLKYIDIIPQFEKDAECVVDWALDPQGSLGAYDARTILDALSKVADDARGAAPDRVPKHVAVLSFAGLDRDDVLLYPLLAHELGHFLDFASDDIGHHSTDSLASRFLPSGREMVKVGLDLGNHKAFHETIRVCLREITADLLAARMGGLGYFFAFAEFFKTLTPWPGPLINLETGYPGFHWRLRLIWDELESDAAGIQSIQALRRTVSKWRLPGKSTLEQYVSSFDSRLHRERTRQPKLSPEVALAHRTVRNAVPAIRKLVRSIIPPASAAKTPNDLQDMVELLADRIPPFQPSTRTRRRRRDYRSWSFQEVMTAGWLYQISLGEERERSKPNDDRSSEYRDTCLLLLKALELHGAQEAMRSIADQNKRPPARRKEAQGKRRPRHGVISGPSLRRALNEADSASRLVVCPDFGDDAIESASRDLHLGHWFRVSKRTSIQGVDIAYSKERSRARLIGQTEVFVPSGRTFVLQPGDFVLAASLEYVYLPPDIMAFVEGKSSLGRAGLLIATATQIAPGFKGCIVLELFNAGTVPVILRPAMRVAQLVLVSTDTRVPNGWLYSGEFQVQVRP